MPLVSTVHLAHVSLGDVAFIALFTNVKNASFLRDQLVAGNQEYEYAFIDANMIISPIHLLAALHRALTTLRHSALRTRNIHSETVFCLSPTNNIADSFRKFGVSPMTTNLLAVKIGTAEKPCAKDDVDAFLAKAVDGDSVAFCSEELQGMTDWTSVNKLYKLGSADGKKGNAKPDVHTDVVERDERERWRSEAESAALAMIALKGS